MGDTGRCLILLPLALQGCDVTQKPCSIVTMETGVLTHKARLLCKVDVRPRGKGWKTGLFLAMPCGLVSNKRRIRNSKLSKCSSFHCYTDWAYENLMECAGLSNLGYCDADGERAKWSEKLGCNKLTECCVSECRDSERITRGIVTPIGCRRSFSVR
jgi:hypothetical protein